MQQKRTKSKFFAIFEKMAAQKHGRGAKKPAPVLFFDIFLPYNKNKTCLPAGKPGRMIRMGAV